MYLPITLRNRGTVQILSEDGPSKMGADEEKRRRED